MTIYAFLSKRLQQMKVLSPFWAKVALSCVLQPAVVF